MIKKRFQDQVKVDSSLNHNNCKEIHPLNSNSNFENADQVLKYVILKSMSF
jgi:hypothetical protein